jgi:hypothetical protein
MVCWLLTSLLFDPWAGLVPVPCQIASPARGACQPSGTVEVVGNGTVGDPGRAGRSQALRDHEPAA